MMLSTTIASAESVKAAEKTKGESLVLSFSQEQDIDDWQIINDGVMGGLSVGEIRIENHNFIFYGRVSTENNGGFTSVYRPVVKMPEDLKSVKITVKGDGKPYQLRIRSNVTDYNIAYKITFATKANTLQTLSFNLADFQASFRGRVVSGAPALKADTISHVGYLIAAKQGGRFSLSTSSIEFF